MLSAFSHKAGYPFGADIFKGHINNQIQGNGIAGVKYLIGFHYASELIQLKQLSFHGFPAEQTVSDPKARDEVG